MSQVYPGWIMRVYSALEFNNTIGNFKLKKLFEGYSFVQLCNVTQVLESHNIDRLLFPMTWRFLPLLDPLVDRMLCRDTDSLVTTREGYGFDKIILNYYFKRLANNDVV